MEFVQAKDYDKAAVMELWAKDFESYEPYYSWYFNTIYKAERTFLLKEDNKLYAAAQLAPYKMALRNKSMDINFTVGVITEPEARGKGLGKIIMQNLEEVQKKQGNAFSVLFPVCPEFYAKLGYCFCYEDTVWDIPVQNLRPQFAGEGTWQEFDITQALPHLQQIYKTMTKNLNGYILRDENNWINFLNELVNDKGNIVLYGENKEFMAFILHLPKEENKLYIREIGCIRPQYRQICLQYIKDNFPAEQKIYMHAPFFDDSYLHLPLTDGIYRRAGAMIRCNDAQKALQFLTVDIDFTFSLQIIDKWAIDNNIKVLLNAEKSKLDIQTFDGKADIILDICSFTQLLWGFKDAKNLYDNGKINCCQEFLALLQKILPQKNNWLSEQT